MSKPTIFFSHSSKDDAVLLRLKELFISKTGGSIDVFLSSDGQSIPLGRNWVHRVQDALDEATLMILFITPNSIRSSWIYFEAGFAYSKNIRVVPVGFLSTNLSSVAPPLSLLQGFNISNNDGLDNLIALANDVFSHNHNLLFEESEYKEIILQSDNPISHPFGEYLNFIENINICEDMDCSADEAATIVKQVLVDKEIEYALGTYDSVESFGLSILTEDGSHSSSNYIFINLDPELIESCILILSEIFRQIGAKNGTKITLVIYFNNQIALIKPDNKLTARLFGTGIKLNENNTLIYNDFTFSKPVVEYRGNDKITLFKVEADLDKLELKHITEAMTILFTKGVLYQKERL